MKFGIHIVLGVLVLFVYVVMQIEADAEETSPKLIEDKDMTDVKHPDINPREGRMWAPWSYAGPVTRGRWNVGSGYGRGPNVAWDSTMSKGRASRRRRYGSIKHRYYGSSKRRHGRSIFCLDSLDCLDN